jgi:endoribonuclease LACTB2
MLEISKHEDVTCVKGIIELFGQSSVVYVYLVDGMLVDAGPQSLEHELVPFLEEADFRQVVITHSHEDHVGCAAWIQEQKRCPIWIHSKGVDACANPVPYPKYRQVVWGVRQAFTAQPFPSQTLQSDTQSWTIIETPGHADDHVVLLNEQTGQLFSGDLFLTARPKIFMRFESMSAILNSLRRVLQYEFQSLFCAHAGYIKEGRSMLQQKLQVLEEMCGEILQLHRQGYSIPEITKQLFPVTPPIVYVSEREFDTEHIVRSVVTEMGNCV